MYKKYLKKANAIINKMVNKANNGEMKENFGNNELRKFNDTINSEKDLSYAERAELSFFLSEKLSTISQNKEGVYYSN